MSEMALKYCLLWEAYNQVTGDVSDFDNETVIEEPMLAEGP